MKKLFTLLMITTIFTVFAQTTEAEGTLKKELAAEHTGWKTGGVVSVNFSQAAYSTQWVGNPANTMTLTSLVSIFANYSDGENIWDNNLDLGYGFLQQDNENPVKSEDKIDLTSKYGRKALKDWYYAALFNFKTQMTPTYYLNDPDSNVTSEFLSPGTMLFAIGMDYKPNDNLTAFISPITYRADMMMNDKMIPEVLNADNELEPARDNVESQIGGYLRVKYNQELYKNIGFESKLEAFSNYDKDPQNLFMTWDNLLSMKVNEYLSANISFSMVNTPGVEVQYKEVLGIGLAYKF
ncbi:MAG: DUF3078 domain-containing protein [Candidatus Delongbacteria bacterium]|nr:DUF3078 domain-containing protein [Candidatus Delongbacteria bacterium]